MRLRNEWKGVVRMDDDDDRIDEYVRAMKERRELASLERQYGLRKWAWESCWAPQHADYAHVEHEAVRLVRFVETGSFDEVDKPA
jgi:hypothetical protein